MWGCRNKVKLKELQFLVLWKELESVKDEEYAELTVSIMALSGQLHIYGKVNSEITLP